jgi:hypothetical protein
MVWMSQEANTQENVEQQPRKEADIIVFRVAKESHDMV